MASFTSNTVTKLNKRTGNINLIVVVDDGTPVGAEIWDPTSDLPVSSMHIQVHIICWKCMIHVIVKFIICWKCMIIVKFILLAHHFVLFLSLISVPWKILSF